ncbi:MAG: fumarate hydratase [Clostridia bacterium]|jgi:fumarate hydratase subunit alpha|nr:fumarate hydratase [Clostridia bacterium]
MRRINTELIEKKLYQTALLAGVQLTPSCKAAMGNALKTEKNEAAAFALETLLKNAETAIQKQMPVCQDTGMAVVILEIGQEVFLEGKPLADAVNDGIKRAYADGYFRKSVCDPITRKNTGDNTPAVIHTEIVAGDKIKITFMPKGFGSENMSRLYMLKPAQGVEGIINAIVETVKLAGSRPCPPVYVGVGIGGTFDTCAFLAKKALTRDIGTSNPRGDIAEIERIALEKINALDIGCQGFHGSTTALGVACEWAPTHIAGLPVAVNIQCHCVRCERAEL